jgi:hypothetical protein
MRPILFFSVLFTTLTLSLPSFSFEIVESNQTKLQTTMNGEVIKETLVDYVVIKAKGVGVFTCDDHPDDPICEFYGFYYEKEAYAYINGKSGYVDTFYALDGSYEEVRWEDAENGVGLEDGIIILYKHSGDNITYQELDGFLKSLFNKFK